MKKLFMLLAVAAFAFAAYSCEQPEPDPINPHSDDPEITPTPVVSLVDVTVQLAVNDEPLKVEGVNISLSDDSGMISYDKSTNADGFASFSLPYGNYSASANFKMAADGQRLAYNGAVNNIVVKQYGQAAYNINLAVVKTQQVIIKELYSTGCQNSAAGAGKTYSNDAYVILYNNTDLEADASDIVFGLMAPSNANAANKFYQGDGDKALIYEHDNWIPAYSALWWFTSEVKIPAYSQIVVAIFGAINHTATVVESVDLSDASYYWMCNTDIPNFKNAKYTASENIPANHYLTGVQINQGNAWVISNSSPGFYIGKMAAAQAKALCEDTGAYDTTQGSTFATAIAKFPKANVVDAVDVWSTPNIPKSMPRFSADLNTNYVAMTNNQGHSIYRNVDKEATEALAENSGKLVYNYAGGTEAEEGSTDPSGIDAEASIANGAHIIYSDTNDSAKDFHQRKVASLKK